MQNNTFVLRTVRTVCCKGRKGDNFLNSLNAFIQTHWDSYEIHTNSNYSQPPRLELEELWRWWHHILFVILLLGWFNRVLFFPLGVVSMWGVAFGTSARAQKTFNFIRYVELVHYFLSETVVVSNLNKKENMISKGKEIESNPIIFETVRTFRSTARFCSK